MIYETRKYITILTKLKITPNQFLFCWLLYNKQWDELKEYLNSFGKFTMQEINDLIDKDLILRISNNKDLKPADLHVTEKFAEEMIVTEEDAWDELFKAYPSKLKVNDKVFASKGITLAEETELKKRYVTYINKNKYEHNKIIAIIKEFSEKTGGYAVMKIDKFIISEYWKEIETERDSHAKISLY